MQCWNATLARRARCVRALLVALLIAAACFFHDATAAAPMRFERLGIDDGLSQQTVLAIAQDATGFMWFGTEDGLDRFDGYSFQHLRQSRADSRGLPAPVGRGLETVRVIRLDHAGRLWIGAREGGVALFDPKEGRLVRLRHRADDPASLADDSVFALLEDQGGAIWVGTQSGLDRLDLSNGQFKHIALDPGHSVRVHALAEDHRGKLWIGTDSGLLQLDPADRNLQVGFSRSPGSDARRLHRRTGVPQKR